MKKTILVIAPLLCLAFLGVVAASERPTGSDRGQGTRGVEIVSIVTTQEPVQREGLPFAVGEYAITVRNNTAKTVAALDFGTAGGRGFTEFLLDAAIAPKGEFVRKMRFPSNEPIELKAVVFTDRSYEGEKFRADHIVATLDEAAQYHKANIGRLKALAARPDLGELGRERAQRGEPKAGDGILVGLYTNAYAQAYNLLMAGRLQPATDVLQRAASRLDEAFSRWGVK